MLPLLPSCPAEGATQCYNNAEDGWNQRSSQSFLQHQPGVQIRASVRHPDHQGAAEDEGSQSSVPRARSHVDEVRKDLVLVFGSVLFSQPSSNMVITFADFSGTSHSPLCISLFLHIFTSSASARPGTQRCRFIGRLCLDAWLDVLQR